MVLADSQGSNEASPARRPLAHEHLQMALDARVGRDLARLILSPSWIPNCRLGYNRAVGGAVRGGRRKIAGTGVTVMRVAGWCKMGLTPEEIAAQYGHLSLAQVHAALTYYNANPEEIEADLADEDKFAAKIDSDPNPRSGS